MGTMIQKKNRWPIIHMLITLIGLIIIFIFGCLRIADKYKLMYQLNYILTMYLMPFIIMFSFVNDPRYYRIFCHYVDIEGYGEGVGPQYGKFLVSISLLNLVFSIKNDIQVIGFIISVLVSVFLIYWIDIILKRKGSSKLEMENFSVIYFIYFMSMIYNICFLHQFIWYI